MIEKIDFTIDNYHSISRFLQQIWQYIRTITLMNNNLSQLTWILSIQQSCWCNLFCRQSWMHFNVIQIIQNIIIYAPLFYIWNVPNITVRTTLKYVLLYNKFIQFKMSIFNSLLKNRLSKLSQHFLRKQIEVILLDAEIYWNSTYWGKELVNVELLIA